MTQTICSLTVGLKWVVVDKWTRYGAIVSFDIITYTGLFWFQMVQVIYRRFWHILRIFFQYLYESRYFDHSCIILCVVPYASEKFGQIWTKMIEEAMMRLFLRKKLLKGEILTGSKNQNLLDTTIRSCLFHFLATWISFNCPSPHCSEKEIRKWSPILELFPNYCLLSRWRRMMTWLALLISKTLIKSRGVGILEASARTFVIKIQIDCRLEELKE